MIFKKGECDHVDNYGNACLTSVTCKVKERMLKYEIILYVNLNCAIYKAQQGFKQLWSCLVSLFTIEKRTRNRLEKGGSVDIVFLTLQLRLTL